MTKYTHITKYELWNLYKVQNTIFIILKMFDCLKVFENLFPLKCILVLWWCLLYPDSFYLTVYRNMVKKYV